MLVMRLVHLLWMPGGTGLQVRSRQTRFLGEDKFSFKANKNNDCCCLVGEKVTFVAFVVVAISEKQGHLRGKNPYATKELLMNRPSVLSDAFQRS